MKQILGFVFIAVMAITTAHAGEHVATLAPSMPKIGDNVTITYNAADSSAVLHTAKEITAQVMLVRDQDLPLLVEVPLKNNGGQWQGVFMLADPKVCYLLFQFTDGEKIDNNGDNVWRSLIADSSDTPIRNSRFFSGMVKNYPSYVNFKNQKDPAAAREDLLKELQLYPDNVNAKTLLWEMDFRTKPDDETRQKVEQELFALVEQHKTNETVLVTLLRWFDRVGQKAQGDSIKQMYIAQNPTGKIAENEALSKIFA